MLPVAARDAQRLLGSTPVDVPPQRTLAVVYRDLKRAHDDNRLLSLPKRVLRLAPWVIFESWDQEPPLMSDGSFVAGLNLAVERSDSVPAAINLAQALLLHFDPTSSIHERLRATVGAVLQASPRPRARHFLAGAKRFGLLRSDGPDLFAQAFVDGDQPAEAVLQEAGLTGPLAYRGFVRYACSELARQVRERLEQRRVSLAQLWRLLSLAEVEDDDGQRRLRFPLGGSRRLVEALLLPYESQEPDPQLQGLIKSFLLHHVGDPRLKRERWEGIDERAQRVMRRWLVAATLEDFFRVLDESLKRGGDSDADRHWPYRRAFWSAYLNRDQITEAWVVLGWRVAEDTKHVLSELSGSYGKLARSSGARPAHAVLIMQIGSLIITEWSHAGKYRVWQEGNPSAPRFYASEYRRIDLVTDPDFDGVHYSAERGGWQQTLSGYISEQTGNRISLRELMPRR